MAVTQPRLLTEREREPFVESEQGDHEQDEGRDPSDRHAAAKRERVGEDDERGQLDEHDEPGRRGQVWQHSKDESNLLARPSGVNLLTLGSTIDAA